MSHLEDHCLKLLTGLGSGLKALVAPRQPLVVVLTTYLFRARVLDADLLQELSIQQPPVHRLQQRQQPPQAQRRQQQPPQHQRVALFQQSAIKSSTGILTKSMINRLANSKRLLE